MSKTCLSSVVRRPLVKRGSVVAGCAFALAVWSAAGLSAASPAEPAAATAAPSTAAVASAAPEVAPVAAVAAGAAVTPAAAPATPPAHAAHAAPGPTAPGSGTRTLYLIRHGEYDSDDPRDAAVGKALTPLGVAQARLIGGRLRGLPVRFTGLIASPLTRARETGQVIADELGMVVRIEPLLEECTPPTWRADIMAREVPAELAACAKQFEQLAKELFVPSPSGDRAEIYAAHGNVIRSLVVRALRVDPDSWLGMSVGHASLTVLTVDAKGMVRVQSVGDVGHLPPSFQTGTTSDVSRNLLVPVP